MTLISVSMKVYWSNTNLYLAEAEEKLNDSKFAQRIVINKILADQQAGKKSVTDTIKAFKQYCKSHSKIVAFYLYNQ